MAPAQPLAKPENAHLMPVVAFGRAPARRPEKVEFVKGLRRELQECRSVIVAAYAGLSVEEMQALRRLAKTGRTKVKVAKNRLAKIAAKGTDAEGIVPFLKGQTVLAYSSDPLAASKAAVDFAKDHEKFVIIGGAVENMTLDANGVKALAELPSLDETRGKIVRLLSAPAARIVRSLREPPAHLARLAGILASRPDLASGPKKDEIKLGAVSDDVGTAPELGSLIDRQALPSRIVKHLESGEVAERLEGIKEASFFLQSQEEGDSMRRSKTLSPVEILEGGTIPERLFERLFSTNQDEARLAAYALVSGSPSFRGGLNPKASPTDLNEREQTEFVSGFRKLLAAAGQSYFPSVEVQSAPQEPGTACRLHVRVTLSRVAPFSVGGRSVLLDEAPIIDKRMRIDSPLAETVSTTDTQLVQNADGLVAFGETDMTIRPEHLAGLKFPVVVHFNHGVDTLDFDVGEFKLADEPLAYPAVGAVTRPAPKSEGS
ncbi:50S ribosomal protein L10 [Bradyrhizobium sp. CCBAU 45394]|uniref:50S ribosomal protein L10 n=1 Tax=Bradyrhizobium sp. CCBAU 45394 TaxID=1325087 RepID=UPI00230386BB|nr:50S ribosomal protein L10 [Bradyrhizobium sp. CCBAU 45394]